MFCGLAKTLHFLNQQEKYFVPHLPAGRQVACNRLSYKRKWSANLLFCFLMADKTCNEHNYAICS